MTSLITKTENSTCKQNRSQICQLLVHQTGKQSDRNYLFTFPAFFLFISRCISQDHKLEETSPTKKVKVIIYQEHIVLQQAHYFLLNIAQENQENTHPYFLNYLYPTSITPQPWLIVSWISSDHIGKTWVIQSF